MHEQRQAEQDGVERIEIQPEVFDAKMIVDPGSQCGDKDRHRYRAPLDPAREGWKRRGMVDRFRFSDHVERLGKLERVGKLGERLGTARVQESCGDNHYEEERHKEDKGGRRPNRGRQRHQTGLLLEKMARRIHQERGARRQPELPGRPGRRRRGEQKWKINLDPLFSPPRGRSRSTRAGQARWRAPSRDTPGTRPPDRTARTPGPGSVAGGRDGQPRA